MRHRIVLAGLALALGGLIGWLFIRPQPVSAIEAQILKVKSDCSSVEAQVALFWNRDDTLADSDIRDYFALYIFDYTTGAYLTHIPESITIDQTPWYWVTHRIETVGVDGNYRLELWDTNADGTPVRRLEWVHYDCTKSESRYLTNEREQSPFVPTVSCVTSVPVTTTNAAPEDGTIFVMWGWSPNYIVTPEQLNYHAETRRVSKGEVFTLEPFPAPCGTYIKVYYQPDSTKVIYHLPSQYWPHSELGTGQLAGQVEIVYHTFFPLDGETRPEFGAPSPTPDAGIP